MRPALAVALVACSAPPVPPAPSAPPLFTEVSLATEHGLSGLAVDDRGALWTVAERAARTYRLDVTGAVPTVTAFAVAGIPGGRLDLEGIAWLGDERFAFGTEGTVHGTATVLLGTRDGDRIVVTQTIELPAERVGIALPPNHGAEGVCGRGETIVVAIEGAGTTGSRRWAPLVRLEHGAIARTYRLALGTRTGKISALDCTIDPAGRVTAWAIERHFEVTRIVAFELPPTSATEDGALIEPRVALDLGAVLESRSNLEGLARGADGRMFAVADNQWKTIDGPSKLLVFPRDAVR